MSSPDADAIDPTVLNEKGGLCRCVATFGETGRTVEGLGTLFTWNKLSPRIGVNIRLTGDNKTILRATAGRYYRPAFPNEFNQGHPGIATGRDMYFDPATGDYTIPGDIYDPRADWELDPDIEAPSTDQFSIGIDREVEEQSRDQRDVCPQGIQESDRLGGHRWAVRRNDGHRSQGEPVDGVSAAERSDGSALPAHESARYFQRYHRLVLAVSRRFANRWAANVGYTLSKNEALDAEQHLSQRRP